MPDTFGRIRPGQNITADWLNRMGQAVESLSRLNASTGLDPGILFRETSAGIQVIDNRPTAFVARITSLPATRTATLVSAVTDTDATLNVNYTGPDLTAPFPAVIDSEALAVFEVLGSAWGVTRGDPPAAHAAGATITLESSADGFQEQWESAPITFCSRADPARRRRCCRTRPETLSATRRLPLRAAIRICPCK